MRSVKQSRETAVNSLRVYPKNIAYGLFRPNGLTVLKIATMTRKFKVGDQVRWNSEAGHVSGTIIKVHTSDFDYKGYTHHATEADPQYEIKSDKSDHIAAHKGTALTKK